MDLRSATDPVVRVLQPEVSNAEEHQRVANTEAHLAGLSLKLDHLTAQVETCLTGIQALHCNGIPCRNAPPASTAVTMSNLPISAVFSGMRQTSTGRNQGHLPLSAGFSGMHQTSTGRNLGHLPPSAVFSGMRQTSTGRNQGHVSSFTSEGKESPLFPVSSSSSASPPVIAAAPPRIPFPLDGALEGRARRWSAGSFDGFMRERQCKLTPAQHLVWTFLTDPESGLAASFYNRLNPAFILVLVTFSLIQMTSLAILDPGVSMAVECGIEVFFLLEVGVLFAVCPWGWHFFLSCYNIIDVLSVMPLGLRLYCIATDDDSREIYGIIFGGVVPVMRLLKTLRRFQTFQLLASAFFLAQEAVPVLIFYYAMVWLLFSVLLFAVEDRSNVQTLPEAMWLSFVSMTTLGYGDLVPESGAGRAVVASLVMISTLYMAIPLGIIGSCFSAVWADRDCILLLERLRYTFAESGCSHWDVPRLFALFDQTKSGSLNALEFMNMATHLKLGLSEDRLMRLFRIWATDDQGSRIEASEFQKALFPAACVKVIARQTQGVSERPSSARQRRDTL